MGKYLTYRRTTFFNIGIGIPGQTAKNNEWMGQTIPALIEVQMTS
jgi:hypothetical protein